MCVGDVLFFRVAESPDFVALNLFAREIDHHFISELLAGFAKFDTKPCDRFLCDAGDPLCGADAVAFTEARDDAGTVAITESVHVVSFSLAVRGSQALPRGLLVARQFPGEPPLHARFARARQRFLACRAACALADTAQASLVRVIVFAVLQRLSLAIAFAPRGITPTIAAILRLVMRHTILSHVRDIIAVCPREDSVVCTPEKFVFHNFDSFRLLLFIDGGQVCHALIDQPFRRIDALADLTDRLHYVFNLAAVSGLTASLALIRRGIPAIHEASAILVWIERLKVSPSVMLADPEIMPPEYLLIVVVAVMAGRGNDGPETILDSHGAFVGEGDCRYFLCGFFCHFVFQLCRGLYPALSLSVIAASDLNVASRYKYSRTIFNKF
jgi:hypothetical protein